MGNNSGKTIQAVRYFSALSQTVPDITLNPVSEDAFLINEKRFLFGVADGYGGIGVGAETAKQCLKDVESFIESGLGDSEVTLPFVYRSYFTENANLLFNAFLFANQNLLKSNQTKSIHSRGGASALFAFFSGEWMTLAHVGTLGAIVIRNEKARWLIQPQAYNRLKEAVPGPEWAMRRSFPTVSFGHSRDLEPEIVEFQVKPQDLILLVTDGVYLNLNENDLISQYCFQPGLVEDLKRSNQALLEKANSHGNTDHQTILSIWCE